MKTKVWSVLFLLIAVLFANVAQGAETDVFWNNLRMKLHKIMPAKKVEVTNAVAGIRGAKNDTAGDIYWKGKEKSESVTEEELQKFNLAMDTKLKGNNEQALKLFEEFLNSYPQSTLRVEGLQAAEKIKIEMGLIPAPAAFKAEAPVEVKAETPVEVKPETPAKAPAKTPAKASKKAKKKVPES